MKEVQKPEVEEKRQEWNFLKFSQNFSIFVWWNGLLPIRSWKLLKECLLISCMLSFRAIAKSARAHRWPHLSSHCYRNTHRHAERDKHAHAYLIYQGQYSELVILVQNWHQYLCEEILHVFRFLLCSCLNWFTELSIHILQMISFEVARFFWFQIFLSRSDWDEIFQ